MLFIFCNLACTLIPWRDFRPRFCTLGGCPAEGSAYARRPARGTWHNAIRTLREPYLSNTFSFSLFSLVYGRNVPLFMWIYERAAANSKGAFGPIHMQRGSPRSPSIRQKALINERTAVIKQSRRRRRRRRVRPGVVTPPQNPPPFFLRPVPKNATHQSNMHVESAHGVVDLQALG